MLLYGFSRTGSQQKNPRVERTFYFGCLLRSHGAQRTIAARKHVDVLLDTMLECLKHVKDSQIAQAASRGAAPSPPTHCSPSTLLPPGCAAVPRTQARYSPPSWKEKGTAVLLVRAVWLCYITSRKSRQTLPTCPSATAEERKEKKKRKTHSPPRIFKEPTDFRFLESTLALAAEKPASPSQKLKTSPSISKQEPSKPGFSYTKAWQSESKGHLISLDYCMLKK